MNSETEFLITSPEIKVRWNEYLRLLGYPEYYKPAEYLSDVAEWAKKWYSENGNPWFYIRKAECVIIEKDEINIDGYSFNSSRLNKMFTENRVDDIFLIAVSAGNACVEMINRLKKNGNTVEHFFLDAYASAVAEYLIAAAADKIHTLVGEGKAILPHYSPGYTGWKMEDQKILWELINKNNVFGEKLKLTESGMLKPVKSMLAIIGVTLCTDKTYIKSSYCSYCLLPDCRYRRVAGLIDVQ